MEKEKTIGNEKAGKTIFAILCVAFLIATAIGVYAALPPTIDCRWQHDYEMMSQWRQPQHNNKTHTPEGINTTLFSKLKCNRCGDIGFFFFSFGRDSISGEIYPMGWCENIRLYPTTQPFFPMLPYDEREYIPEDEWEHKLGE